MQFIRGKKCIRFFAITVLMAFWVTAFNSCTVSSPYRERNHFTEPKSTRELSPGDIDNFLSKIKSANNFVESQYNTARFLQQRGKHRAAIEVLREILSVDPLNVKAYNTIGISHDFLGEFDRSEAAYKTALKIQPDSAYTHNNIGFSYLIQGKYDLSINAFQQAVALNDQEKKYRHNLGLAYARKGEADAALAQFQMTGSETAAHAKLEKAIGMETNSKTMNDQKADATQTAEASQTATPEPTEIALSQPGDSSVKNVKPIVIRKPIRQVQRDEPSIASTLQASPDGQAQKKPANADINDGGTDANGEPKLAAIETKSNQPHFAVQVGAFRNKAYAARMKEKISKQGLKAYISEVKDQFLITLHRVRICCCEDKMEAERIRKELFERDRIESFVVLDESPSALFCEKSYIFPPRDVERKAIKNGFKVEVSNGNGVNKMAQRIGNYLGEKGFLVSRLSNADSFNYSDTIIFYEKNSLHDAYEVAKLIPGYQRMKKFESSDHKNIGVRVLIGKDLIRYNEHFHQNYQHNEKSGADLHS